MKALIFKYFQSLFHNQINYLISKEVKNQIYQKRKTKNLINYPVGTKVIIVGNEPCEDLIIATVVDHMPMTREEIMEPVFKSENNEKFISMGIIHYWSQEKEDALKKLTWDERFNVSCKGIYNISKNDIERKNSDEYRNRKKQ